MGILGTQIKSNAYNFLYNQLELSQSGDINVDGTIDVLDIVLAIDMILTNQYDELADINLDNTIDILDIVIIVSIVVGY